MNTSKGQKLEFRNHDESSDDKENFIELFDVRVRCIKFSVATWL